MITRAQVIDRAREYVGTPFKPQHRMKGKRGGIDCVGLVLMVAEDLGICYEDTTVMRSADYKNYPLEGLNSFVLHECSRRLISKNASDMKPGDVVVMKFEVPCHVGILAERDGQLYLIHAYNGGKYEVTEHILDAKWRHRIVGVFSYPGVED